MGAVTYDRQDVERLLPAVWDDKYLTDGFRDDSAPDPDMPRGSVDHSKGGGTVVAIADIRQAWERADLSVKQRQALLLRYGMDEPIADAARLLGVSKPSVSERCFVGVTNLMRQLNGHDIEIGYEEEDEAA